MKKSGEKKGITLTHRERYDGPDQSRRSVVERSKGEKGASRRERRPREDKIRRGDCSALRSVESATICITSGIS